MREGLTVIIVLLIIGILLDGIRRVRAARRERIHMSSNLAEVNDQSNDDDFVRSEFPSGGARVAGYRHPDDAANLHENLKTSLASSRKTAGLQPRNEPAPAKVASSNDPFEPTLGNITNLDDDVVMAAHPRVRSDAGASHQSGIKTTTARPVNLANENSTKSSFRADAEPSTSPKPLDPEEVIVINVMAKAGKEFNGGVLLELLTEKNLRFGNMKIFHRHKNEDGTGETLFSLANIVKPGTFDLKTMDSFATPGLSIFMTLPIYGDSLAAFGLMARTAKAIAVALDGELKDEQRSVMTQQTFEHCRQRVVEFERKRRLNANR
jgi:cell division protein ZipA